MERVDCLFLHVPKFVNYYRPIHQFIWINFLPMGLLGLADLLQRQGVSTQIVHLGVEWIEDHHFSIIEYIRKKNPRIVAISKESGKGEEKCLSVPDYRAEVERAVKISVLGKDLKGEEVKLDAEGFLARVLQHEIDHLNGTLFIDRIGKLKRQRYVRQRKKALADEKDTAE